MTMKFPNGIMIQTRAVSYSVAITTAWGNAYESTEISLGNWHESFAEVPVMNINAKTNTGNVSICQLSDNSKTSAGKCRLTRPTSVSTASGVIYVTGIGKY